MTGLLKVIGIEWIRVRASSSRFAVVDPKTEKKKKKRKKEESQHEEGGEESAATTSFPNPLRK